MEAVKSKDDDALLLLQRLLNAEKRLQILESIFNDPVNRCKRDLAKKKVYSSTFIQVPTHYYDLPMAERANILNCTIPQMCKSIIFENTAWAEDLLLSNDDTKTNSRYYLVVVQYQGK